MKNKTWNTVLILLIPLGELKAWFYHSDLKVDWYVFSNNRRYLCNVIEDYATALSFIVIFAYIIWVKNRHPLAMKVITFLFIVSVLDLLHLGAFDKQSLIFLKFAMATIIWTLWYFHKKATSWLRL